MDKTLVDDDSEKTNVENGELNSANDEKVDPLYKAIGELGQWQILLVLVISITSQTSASWNLLGIIFMAPKTQFTCLSRNNSTEGISNGTCYSDCDEYVYITEFADSIITEFGLICKKAWLANLAQTVFMFGGLVGSMVFGFIADRYGRRKGLLSASLMHLVLGFVLPLCPDYWSFVVVRLLLGATTAALIVVGFVIIIEITGPSKREIVASVSHVPFITAEIVMPLIAYYLRSWRAFTWGVEVPNILFLLYIFLLPESPRWLVSMGRLEEASEAMKKIANRNNLPTTNMKEVAEMMAMDLNKNNEKGKQTTVSFVDLVTNPHLRMKNIFSCVAWLVLGLCFYGGTQYIGQTSTNVFITISLAGGLQIFSMMVSGFFLKVYDRRPVLIGFMLINSLTSGLLALPDSWFYLKIVLGAISVSCAAGAFNSMYVFTSELFPTVARNMAMGASSTMCRVGSMLAPFVAGMSQGAWTPPLVFAAAPLVAAVVCWCLPETKGKKLMDLPDD